MLLSGKSDHPPLSRRSYPVPLHLNQRGISFMAFDWPQFLADHRIHYVTNGPNTPKGDISVRCPFCHDDPSEHLAISLNNSGWHCWRNREHAGRSPIKLIQALIGCSYDQARLYAGQTTNLPSNFLEQVQAQMTPSTTTAPRDPLIFPKEFRRLDHSSALGRPYRSYLRGRGFKYPESLTDTYNLYYCTQGAFGGRIIFPVYFKKELVSWTGRAVADGVERYKSLTTTPEKAQAEGTPLAIGPITHYLLWYDELIKNKEAGKSTICLCEGPIDALKINYLADHYGIFATCCFTSSPSDPQVDLLHELLPRYKRRVLLLDAGTLALSLKTQSRLAGLDIELGQLPEGIKDPGELSHVRQLLHLAP